MNIREWSQAQFQKLQTQICEGLVKFEPTETFSNDNWTRKAFGSANKQEDKDGGGGLTRILRKGKVFEQAGVNFSSVHGILNKEMSEKLTGIAEEQNFFATGISLVIHPLNPHVPTVHANFRYLEVADKVWFGGGTDLTPYVLYEEDAKHFHLILKQACEQADKSYYPKFKAWCDEYFYLPHRGETRGIGGVFFDYLGKDVKGQVKDLIPFMESISESFLSAYVPIVEKRKDISYTEKQREFQLWRRGRYVEFNLLYDRGTLFGLKTGGRTESILMSLPPEVRWEYDYQPVVGSPEHKLISVLKSPINWAEM